MTFYRGQQLLWLHVDKIAKNWQTGFLKKIGYEKIGLNLAFSYMGVSLLLGLTQKKQQELANESAEHSELFGTRFRKKLHFQPKRPSKSDFPKPTMSIFIDQKIHCFHTDPFREKSIPKTRNFDKIPSTKKILEKPVGQDVKN